MPRHLSVAVDDRSVFSGATLRAESFVSVSKREIKSLQAKLLFHILLFRSEILSYTGI
jgi:hypothetical protein